VVAGPSAVCGLPSTPGLIVCATLAFGGERGGRANVRAPAVEVDMRAEPPTPIELGQTGKKFPAAANAREPSRAREVLIRIPKDIRA